MLSVKAIVLCFLALGMATTGGLRAANPVVVMETSMGTIKVELFESKAPTTVKNFLAYVEDKHYDGLIFHRVIEDFMIQGGGFEPGMKKEKKARDPIKNEADNGLSNLKGTIAMARLGQDVGSVKAADSATNQFFINVADNTGLDRARASDGAGYCVFGRVIEGMNVVDKIRVVKTGPKMGQKNVPVEDVVIKSIRVAKQQ